MTLIEAVNQALEALENIDGIDTETECVTIDVDDVITALRTAIEQAETAQGQQPDAYGYAKRIAEAIWKKHYQSTAPQWEPLDDLVGVLTQIDNMTSGLTTPPAAQRQWVGLTDEEIDDMWGLDDFKHYYYAFARAIEEALKRKNHGQEAQ